MKTKIAISLLMFMLAGFMPQTWAKVSIQGKHFVDSAGAKVIFRGYNLQGKVPPFQTVNSAADLEPLQRVGTNLIRFNFMWEAAEPMPGVYDEDYFAYYDRVINWAADAGMYVIIDFHNNAFSRYAADGCGSGFPSWAISQDNPVYEPKAQGECTFSIAMMQAMLTPENYTNWQDFMANRYGVRDRFFLLTKKLALKYKNHPAVIGFDLNEPMVFLPLMNYDEDLVSYFYNKWHAYIQTIDTHYITFFGDNPFQFITVNKAPSLTLPTSGMVSVDAHFYEAGSHSLGQPVLDTKPNIDAIVATRNGYNIPVLVGEYGVNLKNGEKDVFQYQMDTVLRRFDKELLSSARWDYSPQWTADKKDHFHDEDFSCFDDTRRIRNSCRPRANVQVLTGELYFNDIQHRGETSNFNPLTPSLSKYNQYDRTKIDLSWEHIPAQGKTKIFADKDVIFAGNDIEINTYGSDLWCQYDLDERYIECSAPTAGKKRVTITELGNFTVPRLPALPAAGSTNELFLGLLMIVGLFRNQFQWSALKKKLSLFKNVFIAIPFLLALCSCKSDMQGLNLNKPANIDITYPTYQIYESTIPAGRRIAYTEPREPCDAYNPLRDPFFGDTHIHTNKSLDASIQDTRITPYQAYEFAKGKRMGIQPWLTDNVSARSLQIGRALDFAMVSDHAAFFGEMAICNDPNIDPMGYYGLTCSAFRASPKTNFIPWNFKYYAQNEPQDKPLDRFNFCGPNGEDCLKAAIPVWQEEQNAANAAYDKSKNCTFTAFIGYEHSGSPKAENIHRNVLFKNRNVPLQPMEYTDYSKPENLWKGLDKECTSAIGCEVLTIPHNSNVSSGRMFRRNKDSAQQQDFDLEYVRLRNKYEPMVEVYQHKGDSECSRGSADEFCQFEKFPYNSLTADRFDGLLTQEPSADSFIRWALIEGLHQKQVFGINPFKYGMIASTDTHLGTPGATSETNAPGHGGAGGGNALDGLTDSIAFSGGGLAVVWAEENSREYLFDAMKRKEVYGTSGPRMLVRMFGGWDLPPAMCDSVAYSNTGETLKRGAFVQSGYDKGVPMGGDMKIRPANAGAPYFAVAAIRDPGFKSSDPASDLYEAGNPLQRIQIIKGWVDSSGNHHEKVYDVAGGANGASVNLNSCAVQGNGADKLCSVWRDPDFDPSIDAFYYARVLENPSCRWSWGQCNAYLKKSSFNNFEEACSQKGLIDDGFQRCCLHDHLSSIYPDTWEKAQIGTYPADVQERAWTSPIWYNAH